MYLAEAQLVVLAGLAGTGKSTFAPFLAKALNDAHVFDTDLLFATLRTSYSDAIEQHNAIADPYWVQFVHPSLMQTIVSLGAGCVANGRNAVVVTPFGRYLGRDGGVEGLLGPFSWTHPVVVLATCDEDARRKRVALRDRSLDVGVHDKPLPPLIPKSPCMQIRLDCDVSEYEALAVDTVNALLSSTINVT